MKQLKIILFACVLLLLGGCENNRTGYITKTFVSPSGEYQAEVVQVSLGATGGWSAVFFETDNGGSFPKEKEQNGTDSICIEETDANWSADFDVRWTSDNEFIVIVYPNSNQMRYYDVTVDGDQYTLFEGLTIDNDKTVYHDRSIDENTIEITATIYVHNNLDAPVSFVVRGVEDNYGPRGIFDSRSVNILADTDLETGEGLVIGPNEEASFEIMLTGTKESEETFGDEMPRSLYLRIVEIGTGDETVSADVSDQVTANAGSLKDTWYETRYYPIYLGNPEWGKHDMNEMFDVNNPPLDLLLSMSSDELADLLFESPYLNQMLTYYGEDGHIDYSMMFSFLELHSDIFYELLRRDDGITAILAQYQNSGIDTGWFEDESYNSSDEEWNRFLAEVFGSQFIHYYSEVFTKEETDLAMQIISEKNSVYLNSSNSDPEYFNADDIDYYDGNSAGDIRVMYMTQDAISERENSLKPT